MIKSTLNFLSNTIERIEWRMMLRSDLSQPFQRATVGSVVLERRACSCGRLLTAALGFGHVKGRRFTVLRWRLVSDNEGHRGREGCGALDNVLICGHRGALCGSFFNCGHFGIKLVIV